MDTVKRSVVLGAAILAAATWGSAQKARIDSPSTVDSDGSACPALKDRVVRIAAEAASQSKPSPARRGGEGVVAYVEPCVRGFDGATTVVRHGARPCGPTLDPAGALNYFTLQVTNASKELGLKAPVKVRMLSLNTPIQRSSGRIDKRVVAYVEPCVKGFDCEMTVVILRNVLWPKPPSKPYLQCVARHEAMHLLLGHVYGVRNPEEDALQHATLKLAMQTRWQQSSGCEKEWRKR